MIFLLLLFPLIGFSQDFTRSSLTTGFRSSYFTQSNSFDNSFFYYQPEYQDETFGETYSVKKQLKLRVFDYISSDEHVIIDPLDASLEFIKDRHSFQIGFLRYRFSETFGLQLLDVANPRDYSEFIFNDLSWSKRSVFGMNTTSKFDALQIQLILTLWPNGDRLPYQGSAFDPTTSAIDYRGGVIDRPWFKDLEYGTRLKYLFQNGFDLGVLYYHHFSRPTFMEFSPTGPMSFKARPTDVLVDSLGTSGSYVKGDWVYRADILYTHQDLVIDGLTAFKKMNHTQSLVGVDRTFDTFILGLQSQADYSVGRHFYGIRAEKSDWEAFKPSVMFFQSYKENDQWLQLKTRMSRGDWRLDVAYDNIHGGGSPNQVFGLYRNNDRFLFDLQYIY